MSQEPPWSLSAENSRKVRLERQETRLGYQFPRGEKNKKQKTTYILRKIMTGQMILEMDEETEWRQAVKALDKEYATTWPANHKTDIAYKSSSTPVKYIFELPIPIQAAGAHVNYRSVRTSSSSSSTTASSLTFPNLSTFFD